MLRKLHLQKRNVYKAVNDAIVKSKTDEGMMGEEIEKVKEGLEPSIKNLSRMRIDT